MRGFRAKYRWPAVLPALLVATMALEAVAGPLPGLAADPDRTTVSGLSSGGFMAVQLHVAWSSRIGGAAVVAGGPYGCAETGWWPRLATATTVCMDLAEDFMPFLGPPDPGGSVRLTRDNARRGRIDDPANLADDRVFLFSGSEDRTVPPGVVGALQRYYLEFIPKDRVRLVDDVAAGHGFAVTEASVACSSTETPYINDCDYDTAGSILGFLYPGLFPAGEEDPAALVQFDQGSYVEDLETASLAEVGYIYVPESCREQPGCAVHVALHGCRQSASMIGDAFYRGTGFNRWAESNRIVVLYPQIEPTEGWFGWSANPRGCWDWWGYTGPTYLEREALQAGGVIRMIEALTSGPPGGSQHPAVFE